MTKLKKRAQLFLGGGLAYLYKLSRAYAQPQTLYGIELINVAPAYGIDVLPEQTLTDRSISDLSVPATVVFIGLSFLAGLVFFLRRKRKHASKNS
ncbi:LPXTG cell wall anchor domain-containing protein [Patescibacteria group bacterium]|nr:LPXTG cell wall anchor domain-containing protein [Patescibacteria group bacterium]